MKTLRTATKADFKVGTTLIAKSGGWEFTIVREYDNGVWEARGESGLKCVYVGEAHIYSVSE